MKYKVYLQYWHENSIGEQSEGPCLLQGTFETETEAEALANKLREENPRHDIGSGGEAGAWVTIEG